ncbi:glycoside hydrolase family 99-like domain-containing protein [Pseudoxanthomonas dokdonensis]|uniref:Lipopolysaccharide biosynthesis protein n=1 Tax=Pseudoxanthomonas dokdonensis TaxID=344882 RepID=A0A0R0CTI7_9GAMM|nr:glycoside hydrolase family 99-like domain-containing protein [Pseudoxanthomonas dokdonensis]KRG69626.1 hypothetical protein ABB29_09160 [Pseudoxanthomonas dokdonensis]
MHSNRHNTLKSALFYGLRFVFRLLPLGEARRDHLRRKFLDRYSHIVPSGPRGQLNGDVRPRRAYVRADEPAIGHVPYKKEPLPDPLPARLIAFYLPQFHTIPENDEWWGKGFTEWRNVTRALPQFEGHQQPLLPGDLGFYDLSNPEVMREQTRLAREYGISAFCSYFYWFGGKTLLEKPLRNWLADPTIDFPICLCWANENWTRTWDGRANEVLIEQQHSAEDDLAFIEYVSEYMRDPRYLRVDGKPMLLVYRPGLLPDVKATAGRWRKWCLDNGIGEIHLAYVQSFERPDPRDIDFDAAVEFPPNLSTPANISQHQVLINKDFDGEILDWRQLAREHKRRAMPPYRLYAGVNCGWDNEPRRSGKGRIYHHASPRGYRDWLHDTIHVRLAGTPDKDKLVFINAWNEWAEGAVLEPSATFGFTNLQSTRQALLPARKAEWTEGQVFAIVHVWHLDVFEEIAQHLQHVAVKWKLLITTDSTRASQAKEIAARHGLASDIMLVSNRGRDVLPFLKAASHLLDSGVDTVLKIHTKRSPHIENGDAWRRDLIGILADSAHIHKLLTAFSMDPKLGLVGAQGHMLAVNDYLGGNKTHLYRLLEHADIHLEQEALFPSGSMFWVRLQAIQPLLDIILRDSDFDPEAGQNDGTLAHAVERTFGVSVQSSGFKVSTMSEVCGYSSKISPITYPYAK